MKKQKRISIMIAISFIIQCLSLVTFASNSFASTAGISVQMYNSNTQTYSNTLSPNFKIYNTGTTSIDLSTIKVRYYYTSDGITGQTYTCDYAGHYSNITSSTKGQIVSMANQTSDADTYLEIYFTSSAGVIAPNSYVEVKGRIISYNYQNYTQNNDYSFNPTATNYADSNKVTIYADGVLQAGTAPVTESTQAITLRYEAEDGITTDSSMIKSDPYCSNGEYVGDIGQSNTLTINADIPETGTYTMTIYYRSATNKAVRFTQSNGRSYGIVCLGNGNVSNIGSVSTEVELNEGTCDLVFSNPSTTAPEIDFITITKDLVANTNFELGTNGSPVGWTARKVGSDICSWDANGGVDNSKALSITSSSCKPIYDCSYFESEEIELEPYKYYRAEVLVRTDITSSVGHENFQGANISVRFKATSKRNYENFYWGMVSQGVINNNNGWTTAVINFQAPYDGKVIFRLNNCSAIGTCWFDDFKVYPDDEMVKMESSKVMIGLERSAIIDSGITEQRLDQFISAYDQLVNENEEFTGLDYADHFENEKLKILSRINLPYGGEASTKAFIWWNGDGVKDELERYNNLRALSWTLPHEIGHQFDIARWNFDGEFWASFKAFATLTTTRSTIYIGDSYYGANGRPGLWQYFEDRDLDKFNNNEYAGDYIIGVLGVKSNTSWSSFTKAFQYFADNNNSIPYSGYDKFCLFLDKLDEYENRDIGTTRSLFTNQQLQVIKNQLR
ncbi:cellulose binding domain-containing protein [Acetivibrio mesophilus]|nr:cellulose binding domain-containing protein [Acetivibrio mesophilus]HHV30052.1 hypothetical protein [Clostridium sp.]